jgi:protein-L-isoaspartate(D-aspartate) O-methyltransferase
MSPRERRDRMVELQLARRGITDARLLEAFRAVPREAFIPEQLAEFAYDDTPLPIAEGQTISQPYIVAMTLEALALKASDRVLDIGTGSGYAAAVLSRVAKEVYSVERIESLAQTARERLARLGYDNVHVLCRDGTLGWAEHAPYDAIAVAAGGPEVPEALLAQLAPGGRLVIPVGADESSQVLVQVKRDLSGIYLTESLGKVRFVPLIGEQGWPEEGRIVRRSRTNQDDRALSKLVREAAQPIESIESASVESLMDRIGDARLVLLGEATHGTSEFYRMRARLSQELIERHGFNFVAVEGDWPDAMRVNRYVSDEPALSSKVRIAPFSRFPTWMWRNTDVSDFIEWLRGHNRGQSQRSKHAAFYGLDLYSMFTSIAHVVAYLDEVDPDAAGVARRRYGLLTPWQKHPAAYGKAVLVGQYESSEGAVVATLRDMLERRLEYARKDGERFFDAAQNARVVANAEAYYRSMYYASATSWNLRDTHMFDTLQALLDFHGPSSRGIVWAHNSHVGNARATEMSARGELNIGELCRVRFGPSVYTIALARTTGPSRRPRIGTSRCSGCASVPHTPTATSASVMTVGSPHSCCICVSPGEKRFETSCKPRGSSAPLASSTGRRLSSRATIFKRVCPCNSTSSSGSMKPMPSRHWRRSDRSCPKLQTPIRLDFEGRRSYPTSDDAARVGSGAKARNPSGIRLVASMMLLMSWCSNQVGASRCSGASQ